MIHIDIKKLGRFDRIGHRITGDRTGQSNGRGVGWEFVHVCIDDHSRVAFSEIKPDEKVDSAAPFLKAAVAYYKGLGVTVIRVMTDNGSCYKAFAFRDACRDLGLKHIRTKPYTPKTNGKAELLHPDRAPGMGLRPGLSHIRPSRRRTSDLVAPIQLASASRWYKISNAYQPTRSHRGQPLEAPHLEPHRKLAGKVFRFHQGGHRSFLFLNAKVTACGLPPIQRPKRKQRMVIPPYRYSWVTFHTFCHTWATWMRRYGGADLQGLVATGRWRDPRSAARYTHTAASAEWERTDLLPDMDGGKSVESTPKTGKVRANQGAG